MRNFGELPFGEIPEPLKFVRPFCKLFPINIFLFIILLEITTLSNGIRVCTEKTSHQTATYLIILFINFRVGVYARAGSRNECLETSGSAHLLEKMFLRGTTNKSKSQLYQEITNLGATYNSDTGREISNFSLQVFKGDIGKAVKFLGDIVSNSTLNPAEFELAKEEV